MALEWMPVDHQILPPVFLTAEWRHLVMLNYDIDPNILTPLVPFGTELDSWSGRTLVSVVGFLFLQTRVRGVRIPFHGISRRSICAFMSGAKWIPGGAGRWCSSGKSFHARP